MAPPTKILLICIDSAEPDLVELWSDAGDLPTLRSLKADGAWGVVSATPGLFNHAIWPTFHTGVSPARHGKYCNTQLEPGGYNDVRLTADDVGREPFWNALGRAGRRVAVINVPKAPLSRDLNGVQLTDWGTHDLEYSGVCSWPPEFASEVTARYGADTIGHCDAADHRPEAVAGFRDALLKRVRTHARFADDLLARRGWDMFLFSFGDSHCVGHQCWHIHDPGHPRHDAELAARIGDPIRDVYAEIDAAIGRLLERAGPRATKIVFVGPGMEAHYTGNMLLDPILRKLDAGPVDSRRKLMEAARWAYGKMPGPIRKRLEGAAARVKKADRVSDRHGRSAFAVANHGGCGAIRVNLVGREPMGRVRPGGEFEAYCDALAVDLMDIVNVDSGEKLVRRVVRCADHCGGDRIDSLPDLLVEWNRKAPIHAAASPKIGKIRRPDPSVRTGDHTPHCMVYCHGPGISPGEIGQSIQLEDFAPTVAGLLGVSPGDVDGKPISAFGARR